MRDTFFRFFHILWADFVSGFLGLESDASAGGLLLKKTQMNQTK